MTKLLTSLFCLLALAAAGSDEPMSPTNSPPAIGLGWDPSPTPGVTGYRIYMGGITGIYTNMTTLGNVLTCTLTNIQRGRTYYFTATAYAPGVESDYSNEIAYNVPLVPTPPANLRIFSP